MSLVFPNIWHHRKVADTSAKGCEICYKPSTSVLVTPENKDFFYVCPSHLKDKGFCSPIVDHEAAAAKRKKEMDEELERIKKEYEEKQKKKKEKEAEKKDDKSKDKDKDKDKDEDEEDSRKDKKKEDHKPNDKDTTKPEQKTEEEPRVFALQRFIHALPHPSHNLDYSLLMVIRTFYQQRVDRKRQAEMARKNRERLSNPNFFPSVPKSQPYISLAAECRSQNKKPAGLNLWSADCAA
ncbi:VPS4-associated protein 1 [Biscogniauxia sp. FL1348]|nr:VPS4-associated protein 1 [Biscogniauxia sp. FL1348]